MPVQVKLADGTTLHIDDANASEDDVLHRFYGEPRTPAGFVALDTTGGTYQINPVQVVYVRWVDGSSES